MGEAGSGRLARPSPWGTFTSYSLPASWRTPLWVINCLADNTPRAAARPPIADTQADNRRG